MKDLRKVAFPVTFNPLLLPYQCEGLKLISNKTIQQLPYNSLQAYIKTMTANYVMTFKDFTRSR